MLDVISAILDIENTAQEMMKNAQQQREAILSEARENEQNIKDDIAAEVSRALNKFEEEQKQEFEKESQRISSETAASLERLDSAYEKNHEQWEAEIFGNIIGDR